MTGIGNGRDAVFVVSEEHVSYVCNNMRSAGVEPYIIALSVAAYNAACRIGFSDITVHFEHTTFTDLERAYALSEKLSSAWYHEIVGSYLYFEGVNIPDTDRMNQNFLFSHCLYMATTVEKIVNSMRFIDRFHIIKSSVPVPAELFYVSDVTIGVVQFVCENIGAQINIIENDTDTVTPSRNIYAGNPSECVVEYAEVSKSEFLNSVQSRRHPSIAFMPAWVYDSIEYCRYFWNLDHDFVCFKSELGYYKDLKYNQVKVDPKIISEAAQALEQKYANYELASRKTELPGHIFRNPYISFQFEYIIKNRWLGYMVYMISAKEFVERSPVSMYIYSNAFTFEGNMLAHFYRQAGAEILEVPHTNWPLCWPEMAHHSDKRIAFSRSAAEFMNIYYGHSEIHVVRVPKPLASLSATPENHGGIGQKKLIMLMMNTLEVNSVPLFDLRVHLSTVAYILGIPERLKDRVDIAIRVKRGISSEVEFYKNVLDLSDEYFSPFQDKTFNECVSMSDCVIGMNFPTSGVFEVLGLGTPIIDVQIAMVPCYSISAVPDLPRTVIPRITNLDDFWDQVEDLLFDSVYRSRILEAQRRFLAYDQPDTAPHIQDVIKDMVASKRQLT